MVFGNAVPIGVTKTKFSLSFRITLFRGFAIPLHGFGIVYGNAYSIVVATTHFELSLCITTFSILLIAFDNLSYFRM